MLSTSAAEHEIGDRGHLGVGERPLRCEPGGVAGGQRGERADGVGLVRHEVGARHGDVGDRDGVDEVAEVDQRR